MAKTFWLLMFAVIAATTVIGATVYFGPGGLLGGLGLAIVTLLFMLLINRNAGLNWLLWQVLCLANSLAMWATLGFFFPAWNPILIVVLAFGGGVVVLSALYHWAPKR